MENIKISIITITYNSERTLEQTIKSVENQHYDNLEYIIVDGGSTDSTLQIVEKHRDIISKFVSEPDEGISDAFNKGISMAEGDVVGIINSDDMLCDGALKIVADAFDGITDVYHGDIITCDEYAKPMHILHALEDLSSLTYSFCINHPATFVTKDAYNRYGVFDKNLKCAMDYDLILRFYNAGAKFKYINENLAFYRIGGVNMKMRYLTIDEVRDISIKNGGNSFIANLVRCKAILIEKIRPIQKFLKIHSNRVEKI